MKRISQIVPAGSLCVAPCAIAQNADPRTATHAPEAALLELGLVAGGLLLLIARRAR
ncbi:MAG: hypothetical protein ABI914_02050 [Acidobacteriota bacterium]